MCNRCEWISSTNGKGATPTAFCTITLATGSMEQLLCFRGLQSEVLQSLYKLTVVHRSLVVRKTKVVPKLCFAKNFPGLFPETSEHFSGCLRWCTKFLLFIHHVLMYSKNESYLWVWFRPPGNCFEHWSSIYEGETRWSHPIRKWDSRLCQHFSGTCSSSGLLGLWFSEALGQDRESWSRLFCRLTSVHNKVNILWKKCRIWCKTTHLLIYQVSNGT